MALSLDPSKASIELVLDKWKQFDLDGKRNQLDSQATAVTDAQSASQGTRKKLAEQTREFRKGSDEEKLKSIGSLLRGYQEEIDRLTKRSKFAETSFLDLYRSLAPIPDPVIALANVASDTLKSMHNSKLELQNKQLQQELEEFRKEFQEIQNQQVTIRRLEEKIKDYEAKMNDLIEKEVSVRDKSKSEEHQRQLDQSRERESELQFKLQQMTEELERNERNNKVIQSQYFDLKSKCDEDINSKQLEIDMMHEELERLRTKLLSTEAETEKLREFSKSPKVVRSGTTNNLEDVLEQKDAEINKLKDFLQSTEAQYDNDTRALKSEISRLQKDFQTLEEKYALTLKGMEEQNKQQAEQNQHLQRQLEIFKTLEYYPSNDVGSGSIAPSSDGLSDDSIIDKLLREKSRHLENENIKLRLSITTREEEIEKLKQQIANLQDSVSSNLAKIGELEDDITRRTPGTRAKVENEFSTTPSVKADQMFQVVCNQRDRFKAMVADLETKIRNLEKQISDLQTETATVRADNVKLYEKIRYLQSYPAMQQSKLEDIETGEDPIEGKYKKMYEENMNPFALFNRKEKYDRYKELSTAERVTLRTGQFFLSNKYSRTFIFFYSIALHVLVMTILYANAGKGTVYDTDTNK